MSTPAPVPLLDLPSGTRTVVRQLTGGPVFTGRLAAMGVAVDSPLEVLQNRGRGPVLVLVRDTRIALGRGEAAKILVEKTA
ncbi:MAG TPA: FeoA family protein [Burkholderiales bacterium]|nr:FeoA family protein [Burkholderiales bacterium]